jgi:hypothetical protein
MSFYGNGPDIVDAPLLRIKPEHAVLIQRAALGAVMYPFLGIQLREGYALARSCIGLQQARSALECRDNASREPDRWHCSAGTHSKTYIRHTRGYPDLYKARVAFQTYIYVVQPGVCSFTVNESVDVL